MERNNRVARIFYYIGIVELILGFIAGILIGNESGAYNNDFVWSMAFIWWISSFITGIMFIGFSEIIELLNTKNTIGTEQVNKLKELIKVSNDQTNKIDNILEVKPKSKTKEESEKKDIETKMIYNEEQLGIILNVKINEIIATPVKEFLLIVLENGRYELVNMKKEKPEIVPTKEWNLKVKLWFDKKFR